MTSDINDETPTMAIADRVSRLEERVAELTHKFPTRSELNTVQNALSDEFAEQMVVRNKAWNTFYTEMNTRIDALREETLPLVYKAVIERNISAMAKQIEELRRYAAEQIGKPAENPVGGWMGSFADYLRRGEAEVRKVWSDAVKVAKDNKDNAE